MMQKPFDHSCNALPVPARAIKWTTGAC